MGQITRSGKRRTPSWGHTMRVVAGIAALTVLSAACSSASQASSTAGSSPGPAGAVTAGSSSTTVRPRPAKSVTATAPHVSAAVTGGTYGKPFNPVPRAVAEKYGYTENEYFIDGTATSYQTKGSWNEDGRWDVETDVTAPYTTRIVVRLPQDKGRFNGTVLVEWLNVSAGMDADPDWSFAHDELMRSGYGYIGVSAQKAGIVAGGAKLPIPGFEAKPLQEWDPQRYAALSHPGDQFSYDMFTQAAATTRDPSGEKPFADYDVHTLLAAGESQSAGRMTTYVNAIQPKTQLFDGFLIHSRGGGGAALNAAPSSPAPKLVSIRSDVGVPVFQLETETDLFGLGFHPARQPDTDALRTWEIAGTAHADQFTLDAGIESGHEWDPKANIDFSALCGTINDGPQTYVVRALVAALRTWVVEGTPPPTADPIKVVDGAIARDADGNALGGIRTAAVDVPIAQLSGDQAGSTSVICSLFGFTKPFTAERLAALYPNHADYVTKVRTATQSAVDKGFVLPADQAEIVAAAEVAPVPS